MKKIISAALTLVMLVSFIVYLPAAPLQAADLIGEDVRAELLENIKMTGLPSAALIEMANELLREAETERDPLIAEELRIVAGIYLIAAESVERSERDSLPAQPEYAAAEASDVQQDAQALVEGMTHEYKLLEFNTSGGPSRMQEIAAQLSRSGADGWGVVTAHRPFNGWVIFTLRRNL